MKLTMMVAVLGLALSFGVGADARNDWATAHASDRVSDLTVGDWKAFADAQSIERKKLWYVHGAAIQSFVLPGLGQFKTGNVVGGAIDMAGFVALVGGTAYGTWALLPSDLKAKGLSHSERHDLVENYWDNNPGRLAPALGVAAGGMALTFVYRLWAASDAKATAQANVNDGKVVFEPTAFNGGFGFHGQM